ncbi:hypothetical protein ABPG75_006032 [Micractinium tetrahymenae]
MVRSGANKTDKALRLAAARCYRVDSGSDEERKAAAGREFSQQHPGAVKRAAAFCGGQRLEKKYNLQDTLRSGRQHKAFGECGHDGDAGEATNLRVFGDKGSADFVIEHPGMSTSGKAVSLAWYSAVNPILGGATIKMVTDTTGLRKKYKTKKAIKKAKAKRRVKGKAAVAAAKADAAAAEAAALAAGASSAAVRCARGAKAAEKKEKEKQCARPPTQQ